MSGKNRLEALLSGNRWKWMILLFLAVIGTGFWHSQMITAALFDKDKAVQIDLAAIEDSTLIIGTHLIYMHSLNEQIYQIAMDSASDSGQDRIYYKSELASGMWYDITDAESLKDITSAGTIAEAEDIAELYFTHHTRSDGITYDLYSSQPVCVFDICPVYDLERMPELEALKMQFDMMKESGSKSKTAKRNYNLVKDFFAVDAASEITQKCDEQISWLQAYYEELAENHADSDSVEMVLKVMEKLDNSRRAAVYTIVDYRLTILQDAIADVSTDEENEDSMEINDTLLTAASDSQYAVVESLGEAEGNMFAMGSTILSEKEYSLSDSMLSNAQNRNFAGCDAQNRQLQYLDNIINGRIVNRQGEIELLEELIDSADAKYNACLSAGVTQEYVSLVAQNVSYAARNSRRKEDLTETNAARSELQFFIQERVNREDNDTAQQYILERIENAALFRAGIKTDAYAQDLRDTVDMYTDWLRELLSAVKINDNTQQGQKNIYEQKAALQEQMHKALDALDLDTVKKMRASIEALDEEIVRQELLVSQTLQEYSDRKKALEDALENSPQDTTLLQELARIEAEMADSSAGLEEQSQTARIIDSKNEVLSLLRQGEHSLAALDSIETKINLLTAMLDGGSPLALDSLQEIYQKMLLKSELEGETVYLALQDQIEKAVSESSVSTEKSSEISVQEMEGAIAESLGIDALFDSDGKLSEGVSQADIAAVLTALGEYSSGQEDSNAKELTRFITAALYQEGAGGIFQTKKEGGEMYISVRSLAECLGYRYVWNDTKKNALLTNGRIFYSFTAFRDAVENEREEIRYMEHPALFSRELYLPESFAISCFDCFVYDISGTEYSVPVCGKAAEKSQEILSALYGKGGF